VKPTSKVWIVAVLACLTGVGAIGCGNSLNRKTRAYVATDACGQGPFDFVIPADATTGDEGMEVIACAPRRLAGHYEVTTGGFPLRSGSFGDVPDNQRCLDGRSSEVVAAAAPMTYEPASRDSGRGEVHATSANLRERPFTSSETPFADELCEPYGLPAQTIMGVTTLTRTDDTWLAPGDTLRLRIWSEAPNDLEGAVFLVRHLTSKRTVAEARRDQEKWAERLEREEREGKLAAPSSSQAPSRPTRPAPVPPPPALAEERPRAPSASATWIPGYWVRTGERWGWVAGFWRDEGVAMPPPQVEIPGTPPHPGAVWIGGSWMLRAGARVWIRGRWR